MTICSVIHAIEEFAPRALQESYDNAGLQAGDATNSCSGALLTLDITEQTVREAEECGCNLIISHHPLLFKGVKTISPATPVGRILMEAIRRNITLYSAHTNLDNAHGGVSHRMAQKLGLTDVTVLQPQADGISGSGCVGQVMPTTLADMIKRVKEAFGCQAVRYCGNEEAVVKKVALCGGSGAFLIEEAVAAAAQLYITGDVKYHDFTGVAHQIAVIDAGHYETEQCVKEIFSSLLVQRFPDLKVVISATDKNVIKYK